MKNKPTFRPLWSPELGLGFVALLWGLTFPLIRAGVQDIDPHLFVALRFTLSALVLLPIVLASRAARAELRALLGTGIWLGVVAWITFVTQTIGLQTVTAPRAAFISGTYVLLVPLLSPLFGVGSPSRADWVGALLATLGLFLLVDPSGGPITTGDWLIVVCSLFMALYIHCIQKVVRRNVSPLALVFLQISTIAACSWGSALVSGAPAPRLTPISVGSVVVCSLCITCLTFWLQALYQKRMPPERAALILALEPVFGCAFAWWLIGETLTMRALVGGIVILAAVLAGLRGQAAPAAHDLDELPALLGAQVLDLDAVEEAAIERAAPAHLA